MNSGQMMLTIGALVLLGVTVLSVNSKSLQHGVVLRQTEIGVYAVSLATSYVQLASELNFDERTTTTIINALATDGSKLVAPTTTNLTANNLLGRDAGETINMETTFDDFDDFKNFAKVDTIPNVDRFTTLINVYYIQPNAPDVMVTGPTYFKRMDVRTFGTVGRGVFEEVGSDAASHGIDTIKLSYIFSYFR